MYRAGSGLLERKLAAALATSAGGIEWLWNVNAYMTEDREVTIGMVRDDGTDKPEVAMFRSLGDFATRNRDAFQQAGDAAGCDSYLAGISVFRAVIRWRWRRSRTRCASCTITWAMPAYMVAENQIATWAIRSC